jgi:hypothetical protein
MDQGNRAVKEEIEMHGVLQGQVVAKVEIDRKP